MKVPNYKPYARLENQLPRDLRRLPWAHQKEPMHLGDAAVLALCLGVAVVFALGWL